MKCPDCGSNHKYSAGMRCGCGYRFIFDPKQDEMTDGRFLAMVHIASAADTYHFTLNQLYAEYCRRIVKKPLTPFIFGIFVSTIAIVGCFMFPGPNMLAFPVAAIFFAVAAYRAFRRAPNYSVVEKLVEKWAKPGRNARAIRLITKPVLATPPPEWSEPDIYDYGVERIVIVEREMLVDLFVLNNFHAENRALVISESGYPKYLVPRAQQLLADSPRLPVFLVHDATLHGTQMAERLKTSWLPPTVQPIDAGIAPEDVKQLNRLRPIRPAKHEFRVPIDMIQYHVLAPGLAAALAEQVGMGVLIARQARHGSDGGDSGSFG